MRASILVIALTAAAGACSAEPEPTPTASVLPSLLAEILIADDSAEIPPVLFHHAKHADPTAPDRPGACSRCHHHLMDDADSFPLPCSRCHPLEPAEGAPPDL
jgi:Class III cytochrome C family